MKTQSKLFIGLAVFLAVLVGTGFFLRTELNARYAAYRLAHAGDDATRNEWARELVARAPGSGPAIADQMASGSSEIRKSLLDAIAQLPADDSRFASAAFAALDSLNQLDDESTDAALSLLPQIATDPATVDRARSYVESALKGSPASKRAACRIAIQQNIDRASAVVPLLADEDVQVRRAAVLAVGPVGPGVAVIDEEGLFKLLNDPDLDVRTMTAAALATRGLNEQQIAFGRKLMHPDVAVRTSLLIDLKFAGETIKDVGPWLARLAKDADPSVRAGAARVAFECRIGSHDWLAEMAERDPDGLVRQVAKHYRQKAEDVRTVGYER